MASLIADSVKKAASLLGINWENELAAAVLDVMKDSGIDVDAWRNSFYEYRFPKSMTATTMAMQIRNLEQEVKMLRSEAYVKGFDRAKRTLASFDLEFINGRTMLKPKTRLAEIIIANTKGDLKLSGIPHAEFEQTLVELEEKKSEIEKLKQKNDELQVESEKEVFNLKIKMMELKDQLKTTEKELEDMKIHNNTLEHDLEQNAIHYEEQIHDLLAQVVKLKDESQLQKEIVILEKRLSDVDNAMAEAIENAEKKIKANYDVRIRDLERRGRELQSSLRALHEEHEDLMDQLDFQEMENDRLKRLLEGLANRAGLLLEEVDVSDEEGYDTSDAEDSDDEERFDIVEHLINERDENAGGFSLAPQEYDQIRVRFFDNDDGEADHIVEMFDL
uniref:NSP3 n=1 Tax=Pacific black duck rotavirus G TaxID=2798292 RepID=A0A7T4V7T9_9REOV|nr:NSP3 [Pacific black duck rotavirus G]